MTKIFNIKSTLGVCSMVLLTSCAATRVNNTTLSKAALQQAEQDSLFYRNLFNQTQAAKDSAAVKDFNKIAASMKNLTQEKRKSLRKERNYRRTNQYYKRCSVHIKQRIKKVETKTR